MEAFCELEGGELPLALVACVGTTKLPYPILRLPISGKGLACVKKGWRPRVRPLCSLLQQQKICRWQHQLGKATIHLLGFLLLADMCSESAVGSAVSPSAGQLLRLSPRICAEKSSEACGRIARHFNKRQNRSALLPTVPEK